jgi:hypothetical protein
MGDLPFSQVWTVDFEFIARPGERPVPVCLVARELRSGSLIRLWQDELSRPAPPFPTDKSALFIAYFASAELGCFKVLGWPMPARILDLYAEFRTQTNGLPTPCGRSLLGALKAHGIEAMSKAEKGEMRDLILAGGPYSPEDRAAILDYCQGDVDALARLLPAMLPQLDLPRALLRGRYMAAVSAMEHVGTPIDGSTFTRLREGWGAIRGELVRRIDANYGVFEGVTFKADRFGGYLARNGIPWPRLSSGRLDLKDETFKDMARAHPELGALRQLRKTLAELRLNDLAVGRDGRNRCLLSPFGARSGRNTPSNSKFVFGPSAWLRGLIKPPPGHGIAYVDWSAQEVGIAAALSGDPLLMEGYRSGDPYLAFAKQAAAVPADATKATHGPERERFKAVVLGVNYGMEERTLAHRMGGPVVEARDLLRRHRETYRHFWRWSQAAVDLAMTRGRITTVFGWPSMQANGAEMLRLACCLGTERGIEICAPVHDAVLVCAPLDQLDAQVAAMRQAMSEASRLVLDGFELRTHAEQIRYPGRYLEARGAAMWNTVTELLRELERGAA